MLVWSKAIFYSGDAPCRDFLPNLPVGCNLYSAKRSTKNLIYWRDMKKFIEKRVRFICTIERFCFWLLILLIIAVGLFSNENSEKKINICRLKFQITVFITCKVDELVQKSVHILEVKLISQNPSHSKETRIIAEDRCRNIVLIYFFRI